MRTLLATLLATATLLVGAPAQAGGPTSVLVTSPEDARATALYYSDDAYAALDIALHAGDLQTDAPRGGSRFYNLTWLIHDVSIWRTDQVAVSGEGVWVSSTDVMNGGDSSPWRAVEDPDAVRKVFDEIGMTGAGGPSVSQGDEGAPIAVAEESAAEPEAVAPPQEERTETTWFSLTGWRWAVPGLLVGALAVALLRRRPGPAEPRQELVDGEPDRDADRVPA